MTLSDFSVHAFMVVLILFKKLKCESLHDKNVKSACVIEKTVFKIMFSKMCRSTCNKRKYMTTMLTFYIPSKRLQALKKMEQISAIDFSSSWILINNA